MTSVSMTSRKPVAGNVLAIIMVIVVEMMFFGGLISAYVLARTAEVEWPPSDQPRLPFAVTFGNLLVLLLSAWTVKQFLDAKEKKAANALTWLRVTLIWAGFFIWFKVRNGCAFCFTGCRSNIRSLLRFSICLSVCTASMCLPALRCCPLFCPIGKNGTTRSATVGP